MPRGITGKGLAMRRRIIETAAEVMRERGVAQTSLADIREASGTSSSQLFHYFPDGKAELLVAVAGYEADEILREQQPHLDDLSTWKSWQAWSDQLVAHHARTMTHCGLGTLTAQLDPNAPKIHAVLKDLNQRWEAAILRGVRRLQSAGKARADLDAEQTAAALLAGIQGGVLLMINTGSISHLQAAMTTGLDRMRA